MNDERVEQFYTEIDELKLRGAGADRERWMFVFGCVGLIIGVGLAVYGGMQASGTADPADQWAFLATGSLLGLTITAASAALFVRYSFGRFMRFWLVRLVHEQRGETDRMVDVLERIESRLGPTRDGT
ncbi:MAG: hypothetical protein WAS51_03690 [Ilumatobacteraceae bacterium]|nr:MAG: hypothetical protein IPM43_04455 [Actinomycetota bacterium]